MRFLSRRENNPISAAADRARTDKSTQTATQTPTTTIQTTQQTTPTNTSGGLNWADPEMLSRAEAYKRGEKLAESESQYINARLGPEFVAEHGGEDAARAYLKDLYNNSKTYRYVDPKKIGVPEGFEISYGGRGNGFLNGSFDDKVRISKSLGNDAYLSYDFTKNADGTGTLGKGFIVQENNHWSDNPVNVASLMLMFIPGLNAAVGSQLFGLSGTAAAAAGGAVVQGGLGAIRSGGDLGAIARGAATGAIGGAVPGVSSQVSAATGLNPILSRVLTGAGAGTINAGINGGDLANGAIMGALPPVQSGVSPQFDAFSNFIIRNLVSSRLQRG